VKTLILPDREIACGSFDAKGFFWLGTGNGLLCVDTGTLQYRPFVSDPSNSFSLAGSYIISLCLDRSGILWIGTNDGGLSKLSYNRFKFASPLSSRGSAPGLAGKAAIAIEEDGNGRMWLGTESGNITIYDPATGAISRCDHSTGCELLTNSYILTLFYANGIMYCGHGDGVDAIAVSSGKILAHPLVEEGAVVKRIIQDSGGRLWALGAARLYKYSRQASAFLPGQLPKVNGRFQTMIEGGDHKLWISGDGGLLCYNTATGVTVDYTSKFPDRFNSGLTMGLCKDMSGNIWVGTCGLGLQRYDAGTDSFVLYGAEGMANDDIYVLLSDASGQIWMSTNAGISCFDQRTRTFKNFNTSDGLLSNEGIGRAAKKDSRGLMWFGNTAGVNVIDTTGISVNAIPPIPHITGFKVFDKDVPFQNMIRQHGELRLKPGDNYFTIEYSAMDYTQPEENTYRIMLEGFDQDWRMLSKAHSVSYTNLDGGHYTFKLIAYNSDGVPSASPLVLPIYIAPHFYKTWWFYLLVALLIAGSAYAFYRYRINALKKELALRTAIAADLHDDVGATLSSIKMLSSVLKAKLNGNLTDARTMIDTINTRAATTLEAMSDIVWSINPKNDAGEHLIQRMKTYAAEMLDETEIGYRFKVDEGLDKLRFSQHARKEIYLIYKEALNNAIKYADATRIEFTVGRSNQQFTLQVSDNGKGFDRDQLVATTKGGNGLKNMEIRARDMGASLKFTTTGGGGTTVSLSMPLPHNR
jgi:two-component sensor histidine kinase/streptogramin lyase